MGINMRELRDCTMCEMYIVDEESGLQDCGSPNEENQNNFMQDNFYCASYCNGFRSIERSTDGLIRNEEALKFILAGKSEFVAVSGNTGKRLGFKLEKINSDNTNGNETMYYLSTQIDNKLVYCGVIVYNSKLNKFIFAKGKKGNLDYSHLNVKSILYILNRLHCGDVGINLSVYHVGKCGRCGKKLTTPESILTGLGPTCASLCEVPRARV